MKLAALLMFITDVHCARAGDGAGPACTETFYWDLNDRTRAFTDAVRSRTAGKHADDEQAGGYSAVLHYLKAVADMGAGAGQGDGAEAVARMKAMPTDDDCFGAGPIREDGRKLHPVYLFEVKTPDESKGAVGLLQAAADHPGRGGLPAACRGRLSAGQVPDRVTRGCRNAGEPIQGSWSVLEGWITVGRRWHRPPPARCLRCRARARAGREDDQGSAC